MNEVLTIPDPQIDVFYGEFSPHTAKVYARLNGVPGGKDWRLDGRVVGPECRHAKTLTTVAPLVDMGAGPTLLAGATITDPCPWSPELPAYYRVELRLQCQGRVVHTAEQRTALRGLGVRRANFYWSGKRWVIRGVHRDIVESCSVEEWKQESAVMIVERPDNALCDEASREGVVLIARVGGDELEIVAELRRLAKWPGVAIAVITSAQVSGENWRESAPNLLLACEIRNGNETIPTWAHAAFAEYPVLTSAAIGEVVAGQTKQSPIVVVRRESRRQAIADARGKCDLLQRDLAQIGDFAGYVV